jgi:hypothetical protein
VPDEAAAHAIDAPNRVAITGNCNAPEEGLLQMPSTMAVNYRQMVVMPRSGRARLLTAGVRADDGDAACVTGTMLSALGGEAATITYRRATFRDVLWLKDNAALQLIIAILSAALAILTAYVAWDKAVNATPRLAAIPYVIAAILFVLAAIVATLKCVKDVKDALN